MYKCPYCGSAVSENDRFCGSCGARVEKPEADIKTSVPAEVPSSNSSIPPTFPYSPSAPESQGMSGGKPGALPFIAAAAALLTTIAYFMLPLPWVLIFIGYFTAVILSIAGLVTGEKPKVLSFISIAVSVVLILVSGFLGVVNFTNTISSGIGKMDLAVPELFKGSHEEVAAEDVISENGVYFTPDSDIIGVDCYFYSDDYDLDTVFIVFENTTDHDINVDCDVEFLNSNGKVKDTDTAYGFAIAPGEKGIGLASSDKDYTSLRLTVETEDCTSYMPSLIEYLDIECVKESRSFLFNVANTSKEYDIDAEIEMLFLKDGRVVNYDYAMLYPDNSDHYFLKAGEMTVRDVYCYGDYDDFIMSVTAYEY